MRLEVCGLDGLLAEALHPARCERLEIRGRSAAGENYGSTLLKLDAMVSDPEDEREYPVPMVAKKLPPGEFLRETFNVDVTFVKEVQFYKCVVPALESLQSELGIAPGLRIDMFPKMYGATTGSTTSVSEDAILLLEDLSAQGYATGSRMTGLDLAHCKMVMRELARFHALGIALKVKKPLVFWGPVKEACVFYLLNKDDAFIESIQLSYQENTVGIVKEMMPELADYMDGLQKAIVRGKVILDQVEPFCTITHRDFWVNNMMFINDENGVPTGLKFLDFQMTELSSPVDDLYFFLCTSTSSDAFTHLDELVREYHEELVGYLKLHGVYSHKFAWDEFTKEIDRELPNVLWQIFVMIPIICAENKIAIEDMQKSLNFARQLGISSSCKKKMKEVVEDWAKRGLIKVKRESE